MSKLDEFKEWLRRQYEMESIDLEQLTNINQTFRMTETKRIPVKEDEKIEKEKEKQNE